MSARALRSPYPPLLYRSHTHGFSFPRFKTPSTRQHYDSFGSDVHLGKECEDQIDAPVLTPCGTLGTVDGFVDAIGNHLKKTQLNQGRDNPYRSPMVSLSADFLWATQNACQKGKITTEDQVAGRDIGNPAERRPALARQRPCIFRWRREVSELLQDRRIGKEVGWKFRRIYLLEPHSQWGSGQLRTLRKSNARGWWAWTYFLAVWFHYLQELGRIQTIVPQVPVIICG